MRPWGAATGVFDVSFEKAEQVFENDLNRVRCPCCGRKGNFEKWGFYRRWVVQQESPENKCTDADVQIKTQKERIQRVRCRTCKHTHAVLDTGVVPYRQHALAFILCVLEEYMATGAVCAVSARYCIAVTTLYSWLKTASADLSMAEAAHVELSEWLRNWSERVTTAFLQNYLLANSRLFLERLRPLRPATGGGRSACRSEYLRWPAAA